MTEPELLVLDVLLAMIRTALDRLPPESELARPLREAAARLEAAAR